MRLFPMWRSKNAFRIASRWMRWPWQMCADGGPGRCVQMEADDGVREASRSATYCESMIYERGSFVCPLNCASSQSHGLCGEKTMQLETKFLKLRTPVTVGSL